MFKMIAGFFLNVKQSVIGCVDSREEWLNKPPLISVPKREQWPQETQSSCFDIMADPMY